MAKLTDTQLVILNSAAQRDDRAALPLPASLKITGAAVTSTLKALSRKGLLEEQPAPRDAESWRATEDGRRMMLVVTEAGLAALDGEPAGDAPEPAPDKTRAKKPRSRTGRKRAAVKPKTEASPTAARKGTKQALLIDLLKRKAGATIDEIVQATGWQAHSVRGAISGTLKKKLGLAVDSEKVKGRGRVYRIAAQG